MSCMSLREGNPNFFKRLVERATNRQPLTLGSVNGAGGSVIGLENGPRLNQQLHSSSSTSSISSPDASTARFDDASQCTMIAGGEPRRKSTIQSYLANNPSSSSSESTTSDSYHQNSYLERPYTRKRSCSVPDGNPSKLYRLQQSNRLSALPTNDEDSEENMEETENKTKGRRRKNAVAASTVHDPDELDALVQLHCPSHESALFSKRQRMQQAWEEKFGQKLYQQQQQNKENVQKPLRKRSMSYSDGLNKLANNENDHNQIVYDPSLNLINDGIPLTAARRLFNQKYTMRSALSLQNAVEKRLDRRRSPNTKFNKLWRRLKNIEDSEDDDLESRMENGELESSQLKNLSMSANASPCRQNPMNGLHQHLSNSVSTTPQRNGFLNRKPPSLKSNGQTKQDEQGLLAATAFSDGNLHATSEV